MWDSGGRVGAIYQTALDSPAFFEADDTAARDTMAGATWKRAYERDTPASRLDRRVSRADQSARVPAAFAAAMRRPVHPRPTGVVQGESVPFIGPHPSIQGRNQGRVAGVGQDDLVTGLLDAPSDPFALGRGLGQDLRTRGICRNLPEPSSPGANAFFANFPVFIDKTPLT